MKAFVAAALGCFIALTPLAASDFPTEKGLSQKLRVGMTEQEVVALCGAPSRRESERRYGDSLRYYPSIHLLTEDHEGYMGFQVHLVDGRVKDWQPIRGNPSYAPPHLPREFHWLKVFYMVAIGGALLYGILRAFDRGMNEEQLLRKAFEERAIPTPRLPRDFAFVNRDTTVQEVVERLGPWTARREHGVSARFAETYNTMTTATDSPAIVSYDYELPYNAAVLILPEYPFELDCRVRAIHYRPTRPDDG